MVLHLPKWYYNGVASRYYQELGHEDTEAVAFQWQDE
jgi:hypothetical protein